MEFPSREAFKKITHDPTLVGVFNLPEIKFKSGEDEHSKSLTVYCGNTIIKETFQKTQDLSDLQIAEVVISKLLLQGLVELSKKRY